MNTELFPVLAIKMRECVDEKILEEPNFKLDDFGEDAVNDVMDRLKDKRIMNNKEISYLKALIKRAIDSEYQNEKEC